MLTRKIRSLIFSVLIVCLFAPSQAFAQEESLPELFQDTSSPPVSAQSFDPEIMRSRYVEVDFGLLLQAEQMLTSSPEDSTIFEIEIALFPDVVFTVQLDKVDFVSEQRFVLLGTIKDTPYSEVYLAVNQNAFSGSIQLLDQSYRIHSLDSETAVIEQVNQTLSNTDSIPLSPPAQENPSVSSLGLTGDDDGSLLDVLVLYTPAARSQWGGTSAIESAIDTAISSTNQGYLNSGVNQRMRLVHVQEVPYTESTSSGVETENWVTDLNRLTYSSDSYLQEAHTLREAYQADLVVLIRKTSSSLCGLAWVLTDYANPTSWMDQYAFSEVAVDCLYNYSLAHETGHNLGAQHDRTTAGDSTGAYSYSYGYRTSKFYTIMAYSNGTTRINYWSNPDVSYSGLATGVVYTASNSADNRRTLNNSALVAARFRDGYAPAAPSDLKAVSASQTQINLSWRDNSSDETFFRVERKPAGASTWVEIAVVSANSTSYLDSSVTCGSTYTYRVRASNGNGFSAYSSEVTGLTNACLNTPENLSAQAFSSAGIEIRWSDESDNESGFNVERRAVGTSSWISVGSVGMNFEHYLDIGLNCETSYEYRVQAYNQEGTSNYSGIVSAATYLCTPSDFSYEAISQSRIRLQWADNSQWEENYLLTRRISEGNSWMDYVLTANSTSFEDTQGLLCGTAYEYELQAYRSTDPGAETISIIAQTSPCGPPPAPSGIQLHALSGTLVVLQWEDVLDDETGYRIERCISEGPCQNVAELGANVTAYLDQYLDWGQDYQYRISAFNSYGQGQSSYYSVQTYSFGRFAPLISN